MKKTTVRRIVTFATGFCTDAVVGAVIVNNLNAPKNNFQKVVQYIGAGAVGGVAAVEGSKYAGRMFDEIDAMINSK